MTDRELLEYAAKAAGLRVGFEPDGKERGRYDLYWSHGHRQLVWHNKSTGSEYPEPLFWNPLTDDGDALRLAVKLGINIDFGIFATQINCEIYDWAEDKVLVEWKEDGRKDPLAATCRAITRTAAEIGKKL